MSKPLWGHGQLIARAFSVAVSIFCLLNVVLKHLSQGFDGNIWWIDLRGVPAVIAEPFLVAASALFLTNALTNKLGKWRRTWTLFAAAAVVTVSAIDVIRFYALLFNGTIQTIIPIPFSLFVCGGFGLVIWSIKNPQRDVAPRHPQLGTLALAGIAFAVFPILQVFCFGKTDYRRAADAIVVFGARAYADGKASDALTDRVRTACDLYHRGYARELIFSGGPGDGSVHETEAMRRLAIGWAVNPEHITLDARGLNTRSTAQNTVGLFARRGIRSALAVSHFYHLPRIKMTYAQEGFEIWTVPAQETYLLRQIPYSIFREVAALWVYYLYPLQRR